MHWHDELQSTLPPPRDDEPAMLRRDIVDELADHLDCAMQRELRRTDDARQAHRNVLKRFGHPQRIARQLWLDNMKGSIMTQRILIATNVILAVATIVIAAFVVTVVQDSRQFQAGIITELRTTMSEILDERTVVLASQPLGASSTPMEQPAAETEADDSLHEQWSRRLAALTDNWRIAFATGNELMALPPDVGIAILRENWSSIKDVSSRQQIIKAFGFSVMSNLHPHTMEVMHLGMTDESPDVQGWAMGYLKWIAFQDFSTDFVAYERWRRGHAEKSQRETMIASLHDWIERLHAGDDGALAVLGENNLLSLRDQPFMRDAAKEAGLLDALEAIIATATAAASSEQQRKAVDGALARVSEVQAGEAFLRRNILPIIQARKPSPIFNRAVVALEGPHNAWARDALLEVLTEVALTRNASDPRDTWSIAQALASYDDPSVIPHLIAVIAANKSYETVYGIGWFGLNRLTGVHYDESHDGAWWKQWWENNRQRYPEPVRTMEVPDLQAQSRNTDAGDEAILTAGGNEHMRYRLYDGDAQMPDDGYKLLLVLPGGDGSDEFRDFVRNMHAQALPAGYLLAQLIAPVWDEKQPDTVVWPRQGLKWPTMQFSTEDFIAAVIDDVAAAHSLNERHIFAMGWSSGGPPVYATTMQDRTRLTGAFVAMSVFHAQQYPPAKHAKGRAFYILHSPQDFIAMRFPEAAVDVLGKAGAQVKLQTYEGGHGWHGDVFGNIRRGIEWLEGEMGVRE